MTDSERKEQKAERVEQAAEWLRAGERSGTVAKRLRERYEVSARTAERDISAALEDLAREESIDRDIVRQKLKVDLDWASSEAAKLIEASDTSARDRLRAIEVWANMIEKRARLCGFLRFQPEEGAPEELLRAATVVALERTAARFSPDERQRIVESMQGASEPINAGDHGARGSAAVIGEQRPRSR
jgi:hypothetical protein